MDATEFTGSIDGTGNGGTPPTASSEPRELIKFSLQILL